MESIVARAFKSSSFFSEISTKPVNSQPLGVGEDYLIISPASGDDFSVDEFFDLKGLSEEEEKSSSSSSSCVSSQDQIDEGSSFAGSFSGTGLSASLSAADGLIIPLDDMKELELWSHLMDDTQCDDVFACPTRNVYVKTGPNIEKRVRFEPETKPATKTGPVEASRFPPLITGKPRTKRLRTTGATCAWPTSSLLKPGSDEIVQSKKPRVRKPNSKPAVSDDGDSIIGPVQQRKCTHCQVQKTPQWRTGPFGPKTLCNACGVRFKSGRLFPEYRPACSPTFTSEIHSNSHRKVIEMRKKKMTEPAEPDFSFNGFELLNLKGKRYCEPV